MCLRVLNADMSKNAIHNEQKENPCQFEGKKMGKEKS